MKEDLLQYIWKMKVIPSRGLKTSDDSNLEILNFGTLNDNQGPDFLEGRIVLNGVEFAGSIEIHINGSHWNAHKHSESRMYDNVILHVVYTNDVQIYNTSNQPIPTLELKSLVDDELLQTYKGLMESKSLVPCQNQLNRVNSFLWNSLKDRMFAERLDRKTDQMKAVLSENKNDWEETFYQFLFKYSAMGVNADNFYDLAKSVPLKYVRKIGNDPFILEAIYFGQSNLLDKADNSHMRELDGEYEYQKLKYNLVPNYFQMKFSRMRPANFPTKRLFQLTSVLAQRKNLFRSIIESNSVKDISDLFTIEVTTDPSMGSKSNSKISLGSSVLRVLVINVVVPIMYLYGRHLSDQVIIERSKAILEEVKSENNKITRIWNSVGVENANAYDSQALIQLYQEYCSAKKCLNCGLSSKTILNR
ncbi:MAG: hypothetical protein ACI9J3_001849 [Parvicellaceae bacterium]|jgi:hypothetical protein